MTTTFEKQITDHAVVSQSEWIARSAEFLVREKAFTREREELARMRRELPWVRVEKDYTFSGPDGTATLAELFGDNSQLIVYHCMWAPGETDGCPGCSFICDHVDAARQHFEHKDIAFAAISRAPYSEFASFKERMGWTFPWLSSEGTSFNFDFGVSFKREDLDKGNVVYNFKLQKLNSEEQPGLSVFYKNENGEIFRTYSTYERGLDMLIGAYHYIDLTPVGRNESGPMDWVSLHDRYDSQ